MRLKTTNAPATTTPRRTHADLLACMGAASVVLDALPDTVVRMPRSAADAFLLIDPALFTLHRQLLDARRNRKAMNAFAEGTGDPMLDALDAQVYALEQAYEARLAALKKKREEGRSAKRRDENAQPAAPAAVHPFKAREPQTTDRAKKDRDDVTTLWLFALLIEQQNRHARKLAGLAPRAA